MTQQYSLLVKQTKTGEPYIRLPSKLLKELKWKVGQQLEWLENKDGSFTLKKYEANS